MICGGFSGSRDGSYFIQLTVSREQAPQFLVESRWAGS